MGLTIHYTITARRALTDFEARRLVSAAATAVHALTQKRGHGTIISKGEVDPDAYPFWATQQRTLDGKPCFLEIPPLRGYAFELDPGGECESATFGLCKYPATLTYENHPPVRTRLHRWRLHGCCKTQYSDTLGWDHFFACHELVISAALVWKRLGCDLKLIDEGRYWPGRSKTRLRQNLADYHHLVAGLGGALKDAAEERGDSVEAPIFAHPRFEPLEAEAHSTG
jgi:hypothetical protein